MRQFVIGDIHGCYDEFLELVKKIKLRNEDQIISLGDLVNKGEQSNKVSQYFMERPNSIAIIGNHEMKHIEKATSLEKNIIIEQYGNRYFEFINWLMTLDYYYETENSIIIHAFWEHDKSIKNQDKNVLAGTKIGKTKIEKKYSDLLAWQKLYRGKKTIIYGHSVVGVYPVIKNKTIGIDTGCCYGLRLTALELPNFIVHQVEAKKIYRNLSTPLRNF